MSEKKSFFQTLPGILTGLAALLSAVTGLYIAFRDDGSIERSNQSTTPPIVSEPQPTQRTLSEEIRGIWKNEDSNTRGVTKIVILRKNGETFVHAWGKCHPQDCDWGEAKATIEGDILKVTWYWAAGERDMSLRLVGDRLQTETIHVYSDNRPPRRSSCRFVRGS
jgi:hypothetical protein